MSYQVLARKWRPQRFDDVVGQQAVTRTLRNAITSGRVAQAFVFAGPRGCGKTTTARILARALNCQRGPTPDPCGECDACLEIAQGRDIDVLEIDAASHTGIDNIREVVIAGLAIAPVRNRYKVFIIDEVHQLSSQSFNALLKSIEEPPSHVVFMMATTELHKIPDTILSRSQVYEFRQISTTAILGQLRTIATAEGIEVSDAALALIARAAEGSMRDAQSAFDQVIAFAGQTIAVEDASTVLGLVGRELLFDLVEAVVEEDAPAAFAIADRAVEAGHELRLVLRELAQVVRDLMILSVDPSRLQDEEFAEGERERLQQLAGRFSREDAMRAFDLLAKAEVEIRTVAQPRYYFEMIVLRWMHLRQLVPLAELMEQISTPNAQRPTPKVQGSVRVQGAARVQGSDRVQGSAREVQGSAPKVQGSGPKVQGSTPEVHVPAADVHRPASNAQRPVAGVQGARAEGKAAAPAAGASGGGFKDAFLAEVRAGKAFFYNTVVAQAQRIEVTGERVTFSFLPAHRALREQFDQARAWLEGTAERVAGRRVSVVAVQTDGAAEAADTGRPAAADPAPAGKRDLKAEALSSTAVQAMLDVFPAEIRDIEEM